MIEQDKKSHENLFTAADVTANAYYENEILVLRESVLKEQYRKQEFQLFYATGGFGCDPTKIGRRVMGFFLSDGENTSFYREDFLGVIKPENVPEWARNNLAKILAGEEIEQSADAPADAHNTINQQNM